jgi:hypothetical protein
MVTIAESTLSPEELRLVRSYRVLSDETQRTLIRLAESCADKQSPLRAKRRPSLQIVAGGRNENR